jgi:hypothetical protein
MGGRRDPSPLSRPNHERAYTVAGAGIDAMDRDDLCDEGDFLGDNDDDDKDADADNVVGVGRRTQGDRQNNPADWASDWRQETRPTKMPSKSRLGATVRTFYDDGPGGDKPTDDESASGGRGCGPNHDRTAGTAVARTCTVLAGV